MLLVTATALAEAHKQRHKSTINKTLGPETRREDDATAARPTPLSPGGRPRPPAPPPASPAPRPAARGHRWLGLGARAGLPGLGARLGMPAALPWRRGPAAHRRRPGPRRPARPRDPPARVRGAWAAAGGGACPGGEGGVPRGGRGAATRELGGGEGAWATGHRPHRRDDGSAWPGSAGGGGAALSGPHGVACGSDPRAPGCPGGRVSAGLASARRPRQTRARRRGLSGAVSGDLGVSREPGSGSQPAERPEERDVPVARCRACTQR